MTDASLAISTHRCYIPCDDSICPGIHRTRTVFLWKADLNGVDLCYSFENCGSTDYWDGENCIERGGQYIGGQCSCDLGLDNCEEQCGDGARAGKEMCDDGNMEPGDGCDDKCQIEAGYECSSKSDSQKSVCKRVTAFSNVGVIAIVVIVVILLVVVLGSAAFIWIRRTATRDLDVHSGNVVVELADTMFSSPRSTSDSCKIIPFEKLSFIKSLVGENREAHTQRAVLSSDDTGDVVHVALKAVSSGPAAVQSENKARLREELANLWSLSHPNLVRYMGWSVDYKSARGITTHVIMELKPSSLKRKLKSRPPSPEAVLLMGVQVARGLDFLHSHNIGHGAIQPNNVLLETDNSVCLCGFGLTTDRPVAPCAFTAPEMLEPNKGAQLHEPNATTPLDEMCKCRADCYSLAMLLWCLFSWQTPFPEQSGEEAVAAAAGKRGTRPPLNELGHWPKRALQLMQRMWVADPKQRGDMSAACQTLTLCLTHEKQGKGLQRLSSAKRTCRDAQIMYGLDIPTFAPVLAIAERTFATSNYKLLYTAARSANVPSRASQLLFACEMLVKLHAEKHPLPSGLIMDTTRFLKKMNAQVSFNLLRECCVL